MSNRKIVVVGGVAGGATAAARARRTDEHAEIIMFEKGPHISYANCGLPYYVGGEIGDRSALLLQTPESFSARFNVDVRVGHEVLAIDRSAKRVTVRRLATGEQHEESYTALILAPGAKPIRPPLPGIDLPGIYTLRNVLDADEIRSAIEGGRVNDSADAGWRVHGSADAGWRVRTAIVVGAGFIGLEMAENLLRHDIAVTVVEKAPQVLPPLDPEMAAFVSMTLEQMGVEVISGDGIAGFTGGDRATAATLESGRTVEGDLFILGIGVSPDLTLARAAGLAIGPNGGIQVDQRMRTSDPCIYACGDAVETVHLVTGKTGRMPLAGPANKQGRVAGANAAGGDLTFPGALGTAIVRVGETVAGITGLSERTARQEGLDVAASFTVSGDHADYYPGAQDMVIKVVYERKSGRLLGAQVVGSNGVDKRIDVFATAIMGGLTVEQLTNLDLAYAPPFGSAKDPVIVAGMVAQNQRQGQVLLITPPELAARLQRQVQIDAGGVVGGLQAGAGGAEGVPQAGAGDMEYAPHLQLVDVRPAYEADLGGVAGAINIYVDDLRTRLSELDPSLPTVVYDQNGAKGYVAARILAQHGFEVASLAGGYIAWSAYEAAGLV